MRARQEPDAGALVSVALDRVQDGVLVLDDDARVLHANAAALRLLAAEDASERGSHLPARFPPALRERVDLLWREAMREGGASVIVGLGGPEGARELGVRVQRDVAPGRHLVLLHDVTEAQDSQRELEAARRQLAQTEKLSALGTLTSGVAHEVRTPLTFIASNLYLLRTRLERAAADGDVAPGLIGALDPLMADALDGVDRINQLVLELRRFSRLQPGNQQMARLEDAVRDAVRLFKVTSRGSHRIRVSAEEVPPMLLNGLHVQQVILNLLENAADATPADGVVRVELRATPEGAELLVSDEGAGMPPDVQARIFEAFYTTKSQGTGLGLSIVRRVVEEHGGRVECTTAPGRGTSFRLTFPRRGPACAE